MNLDAVLSTGLVHFLGTVLALTPLGHRLGAAAQAPDSVRQNPVEMQTPALALVAESGTQGSADGVGPSLSEGRGCPTSPSVDTDAQPAFPLVGGGRPFQHVPRARWSPVFCVRIGQSGDVLELHAVGIGSGNPAADRATLHELARLRFRPARRGDRPVEAWHRVLVYLAGTSLPWVTDNPGPHPLPLIEEPLILTD